MDVRILICNFNLPLKENKIFSLLVLALRECDSGSNLREIILLEQDELSLDEIIAKGPIWLKLLKLEGKR